MPRDSSGREQVLLRERRLVAQEDAAIRAALEGAEGKDRTIVELLLALRHANARVQRLRAVAVAARDEGLEDLNRALGALRSGNLDGSSYYDCDEIGGDANVTDDPRARES